MSEPATYEHDGKRYTEDYRAVTGWTSPALGCEPGDLVIIAKPLEPSPEEIRQRTRAEFIERGTAMVRRDRYSILRNGHIAHDGIVAALYDEWLSLDVDDADGTVGRTVENTPTLGYLCDIYEAAYTANGGPLASSRRDALAAVARCLGVEVEQ